MNKSFVKNKFEIITLNNLFPFFYFLLLLLLLLLLMAYVHNVITNNLKLMNYCIINIYLKN